MELTLLDVAWHRAFGQLAERLDQPDFWRALADVLHQHVQLGSWVALLFSDERPRIFAESPYEGGGPDPLFHDYVQGLYLLDPFYIANRERPASGLFRLTEVAPECFGDTEYYRLYFTHNVVQDEVQYNVCLSGGRTVCLSLGSRTRFEPQQIALLDLVRPWVCGLMRQRLFFEAGVSEPPNSSSGHWQGNLEEMMTRLGTPLTDRELDVIRLVLSGCSNKETAAKLDISSETVKVHRRHVYAKLKVKSQAELFKIFHKAQTRA
ncbi:LuxR C-terminal-related transcriptional regulator [Pseudomonas nitroreducens]|uniref:LuxR C-terminal-related transcriptional regulator n=1 Tax=Pseudomonas TaxID=286 RepID=UPI0007EE349A|nr:MULTISPECIES: LuxR C-terminal-related transcriptional regulator [Pseudomonas]MDG9853845.1 LuxR C-terminal-related transcriptional regulator [Pseudomonas nitroreducens]MDH1072820.1 LuxR C-terminal-related transcriptional regulator [Pseudomonas nitroreducens]NMZ72297.1 LuxR family transcriptional regulator [Pseudomonas nitroreducens]OBY48766.1 helix-turn-helix transcriptional regulator [Pseudomonas sp. AU12215]